MRKELFVFKIRKELWVKEHFSSESYDVLNIKDLPFEEINHLRKNNEMTFLWNLSGILEHIACRIYICQIHYSLSDNDLFVLRGKCRWAMSTHDYAERWYEEYFKNSLKGMPKLHIDEQFVSEFGVVLNKFVSVARRRRFLYSVNSCCFLSKAKKEQVERIRKNLDSTYDDLCKQYKYVGLYGFLVYAYAMFVQRFSDDGKFARELGLEA